MWGLLQPQESAWDCCIVNVDHEHLRDSSCLKAYEAPSRKTKTKILIIGRESDGSHVVALQFGAQTLESRERKAWISLLDHVLNYPRHPPKKVYPGDPKL